MKSHIFVLLWLLTAPVAHAHHTSSASHGRQVTATVYDGWYDGRVTSCGNTYRHWGISAAHPWLPCNTPVRVSHQGRTLTVRVTDRCDCASLDLSAGAAYRLGVPLDGIATVAISHP